MCYPRDIKQNRLTTECQGREGLLRYYHFQSIGHALMYLMTKTHAWFSKSIDRSDPFGGGRWLENI